MTNGTYNELNDNLKSRDQLRELDINYRMPLRRILDNLGMTV
jgi:hypothetical protein